MWTELRDARLATFTKEERVEFDGAYRATALAALIGDKVRASREAASLTQKELAERVGCSHSEIANIEAGSVAATLSMLACIADSLGLTLTVVLHRTFE